MRHWIQFLALMLVLGMGACSSEEMFLEGQNNQEDVEITEIVAVINGLNFEGLESRTIIDMGESSISKPVWADKDTIGIYPAQGDQLSFPIVDGVGTSTCIFNGGGWALKGATTYTAYSPFNRAYYYKDNDKLPVSMLGQKQVGNNNSAHLGKYDLQIAKSATPESGKAKFTFEHQVCFVRMDLKAPVAAAWESITLESDALFTTEVSMNLSLETPTLTATSTANSVTLDLENVSTQANETITAYMVVLPVNLTDKSLDVILVDSEGNRFRTKAVITNDYRNFKAGYARWITANDFPTNIYVEEAGTLSNFISSEEISQISSLKIRGNLNGDDIKILRTMCGYEEYKGAPIGKLDLLDLSEASIVEGGNYYYCHKYSGISYSTSNNSIGELMFNNCDQVKKIILPNNITKIEYGAFSGCSGLVEISISDTLLEIEELSFSGCLLLSKINIPNSVTKIGYSAFANCTSLDNVIIGDGVTSIGESAFYGCTSLRKINIPQKIACIESETFYGCSSLTNISLNESITKICDYAFYNCSAITNINLPNTLTAIGAYAFSNCTSIVSLDIPNNVTNVGYASFRWCSKLRSLRIGNSVTSIGGCAFYDCVKLNIVYCYAITPPYSAEFENIAENAKLFVPKGTISAYRQSSWGDDFYISEMDE